MKKISTEITFLKITKLHTLEINGKQIRVYEHKFEDVYDTDYDTHIDENDRGLLTDEELEELEDNLSDLIKE